MEVIKVKYFDQEIARLAYIGRKSYWIDLPASETVELKAGEFKLVPLGVAMEIQKGMKPMWCQEALRLRIMGCCRQIAAA